METPEELEKNILNNLKIYLLWFEELDK